MKTVIANISIFVLITITGCKFANIEQSNVANPFAMFRELSKMDIVSIVALVSIVSFFTFLSIYLHCEKIIKYDYIYGGITRERHPLYKESKKMVRRMIISIILAIICSSVFIHTKGMEGVKELFTPKFLKKEKIEEQSSATIKVDTTVSVSTEVARWCQAPESSSVPERSGTPDMG